MSDAGTLSVTRHEFEELTTGRQGAILMDTAMAPKETPAELGIIVEDEPEMKAQIAVVNVCGSVAGLGADQVMVTVRPVGQHLLIAPGMPWVLVYFMGRNNGLMEYQTSDDIEPWQMGEIAMTFDEIARFNLRQQLNAMARAHAQERNRLLVPPGVLVNGPGRS